MLTSTVAIVGLVAACGSPGSSSAAPLPVVTTPGTVPRPDHVLVVVFENKSYDDVVGSPAAPYLTWLAHSGADFTDAHGEAHPSQPNYVALLSGSTQGVASDLCPQELGPAPTLASQLSAAGLTFTGFSEGMPRSGDTVCTSPDGRYARKHNPWVDFTSTPPASNATADQFPRDPSSLPTVAVLIPDMCHDMHDCPVSAGDSWAHAHLQPYVDWARTHNSLLVVTFDEDDGTRANRIPTLAVGPMVRPGTVSSRIDHYTLLRTVEDAYGLPALGAAASTAPLLGMWRR